MLGKTDFLPYEYSVLWRHTYKQNTMGCSNNNDVIAIICWAITLCQALCYLIGQALHFMKWGTCPRRRARSSLGCATVLEGSKILGKHTYRRISDADNRYQEALLRGGMIDIPLIHTLFPILITPNTPSMNIYADNFLFCHPAATSPFG